MFRNIGKKIKGMAIFLFILGAAAVAAAAWLCYDRAWFFVNDPERVLSAAGVFATGVFIDFLFSALLYGCGQVISTAEDVADSNDEIVRRLDTLTERVEKLPVVPLSSRREEEADSGERETRKGGASTLKELPRENMNRTWSCPECGNVNSCAHENCVACGETGRWKCAVCGKLLPAAQDVCPDCGTKDVWVCRECGEKNPRNDARCLGCGRYREQAARERREAAVQ